MLKDNGVLSLFLTLLFGTLVMATGMCLIIVYDMYSL